MAEALLRARTTERAPQLRIGSFGRLFEGEPAHRHARAVAAEHGADLDGFRSRRWTAERLRGSALVLTMEREHTRELAVLEAGSINRIFTLPEFNRLADDTGPRPDGTPLRTWVASIGARRDLGGYLRDDPSDEIADPIGRSRRRFRACAAEIDTHLARITELAWPDRRTVTPDGRPTPSADPATMHEPE